MPQNTKSSVCFICFRRFPDTNYENYSKISASHGYDITVVSPLYKGQAAFERIDGREVYRIEVPARDAGRRRIFTFLKKAAGLLNERHFDIVQIHHTCHYFLLLKLLNRRRAKYVYHITSYPISHSHAQSLKQMYIMYVQCLFMDSVIVQSPELKEKLVGIRHMKKARIVPVGYNGRLFAMTSPAEKQRIKKMLHLDANDQTLVYCGSIAKFRNMDILLEAFKRILRRKSNVRLLMIGDGDDSGHFEHMSEIAGVRERVIFCGRIEHARVSQYLNIADIGISYVPVNENYNYNPPLKTFEYLACGLPTVATNTVSNRRIIQNGFNGVLVDDDPVELADAVVDLLENDGRRETLRRNARESIAEFDFEAITTKTLIPLYQTI